MSNDTLPELPDEELSYLGLGHINWTGYTADQMRNYALAAIAEKDAAEIARLRADLQAMERIARKHHGDALAARRETQR